MIIPFQHNQHAHCESGATTNLFRHYGVQLSEAMTFGIGAGLYFTHPYFIKILNAPAISFRYFPGVVFNRTSQSIGADVKMQTFRNRAKAMQALDDVLETGTPVGLITDIFYLDYLPEMFRFHFNAHNLIVFGKENGKYIISDSILEIPVTVSPEKLMEARFGTGFLSPHGKMYYIKNPPEKTELTEAIRSGIKKVCYRMLRTYIPWAGYRGIHMLADRIKDYPKKLTEEKAAFYLSNIVRMQEVVGTGGSGYRYLYADFLKEAGEKLQKKELAELSEQLILIAGKWRVFALQAARLAKNRASQNFSYNELGDLLHGIADDEKDFFTRLKTVSDE